jgi:hypothetical protein
MTPAPPAWAEALLRLFVKPGNYDNVSGDLLEEYRDSALPTRGPRRADLWYVRQVLGFMTRGAGLWAALFGAAFIARTAMDWLLPTVDFHARSMASTWLGIGILLAAGFAAALRSGSIAAGTVLGLAEVFTLPIAMVVPGAALGTVGGAAGAIVRRLRAA